VSDAPYTFGQARNAAIKAANLQEAAEDNSRKAADAFADAEKAYRMALAKEIVRQHAEEGVAWTAASDLARGASHVADLRYKRDVAEGVKVAAEQAAWRATGNRQFTLEFINWSKRRELAEGAGAVPEPDHQPIIGGRRA
jgi:hypothetical protein